MTEKYKPPVRGGRSMLTPLTPEYLESEHGIYVAELDAALAEPGIRNIALSGTLDTIDI